MELLFVGAETRMEMEKVPAAGYRIIGLPVSGMPRKPGIAMLRFAVRLLKSYNIAKKIITQFKPQIAVGVGGFASGPLLRAAAAKGIPYIIQEQNSYAGITNKLLGKKAKIICVAFDRMERYFPPEKIVLTGNPVRENLGTKEDLTKQAEEFFELKKGYKVILLLGGSLGARSLNDAMRKGIDKIAGSGIQFIWQTGSIYYKEMLTNLENKIPDNLKMVEFISRMDLAYAAAGVIISRAGAGTISELCVVGKPAILVPSPNVAEDHQTKNALALVEKKAAVMISDNEIDIKLIDEAIRLINSPDECIRLSKTIKMLARPDATRLIVDEAEKILK